MSEKVEKQDKQEPSEQGKEVFDVDRGRPGEDLSVSARENDRSSLEQHIEAFLSRGGKIAEIAPNVMSDPPRKPQSNYGGRPI